MFKGVIHHPKPLGLFGKLSCCWKKHQEYTSRQHSDWKNGPNLWFGGFFYLGYTFLTLF